MNKKTLLSRVFIVGFIIAAQCFTMFDVFTNAVSANTGPTPVIDSVSPISATRLQTIIISGSGFGDIQPQVTNLSDGSLVTLVGGTTPVIRIYDVEGWDSWEAGCEDSQWVPGGLIGVYLTSWSDTEIVLCGFETGVYS
jgi:hypothetical protein